MAEAKKTTRKTTKKVKEEPCCSKDQTVEEIKVMGNQLVDKVKELIKEGNVRRIIIKKKDRTLLEIPMTFAVVGVALLPVWAALGALAALITECTLEVQRDKK